MGLTFYAREWQLEVDDILEHQQDDYIDDCNDDLTDIRRLRPRGHGTGIWIR